MKNLKTKIILVLFTSVVLNSFSQVNLDSALIGYYPFNGNANDESFNSYDGDVTGAVLTTDRNGNPNSAYYFEGDDYISTAVNIYGGNKGSISAWVYIDSLKERLPIFSQGDISSNYNSLRLTVWDDSLSFVVDYRDCGSSDDYPTIKSLTQIPEKEWAHLVVTTDSIAHKLYVNGELYSYTEIIPANGEWFGNLCSGEIRDTYIGAWFRASNNEYFCGKIDEVRIYDREINQSEVTALYNGATNINKINNNNISIFPNPSKNYIQIQANSLDIEKYSIIDINGKTIKQINYTNNNNIIDISNLPNGVYILNIVTENTVINNRFIKE